MSTTQNTGWNLLDFDTAGWADLTPTAGDRIVAVYGIGCGEAFGRLVRQETTRWGTHWVVRMDDGTETTFHGSYRGRALATPYRGGTPSSDPVLHHETKGIGTYVVRAAAHYSPFPGADY